MYQLTHFYMAAVVINLLQSGQKPQWEITSDSQNFTSFMCINVLINVMFFPLLKYCIKFQCETLILICKWSVRATSDCETLQPSECSCCSCKLLSQVVRVKSVTHFSQSDSPETHSVKGTEKKMEMAPEQRGIKLVYAFFCARSHFLISSQLGRIWAKAPSCV